MFRYFVLFFIFCFSCSSSKMAIHKNAMDDYNLLFEYLNKDYAYKDGHSFTMDELKLKYYNELKSNPTKEKLVEILIKIEHDLKDPHFQVPFSSMESSSKYIPNEQDDIFPLFEEIDIVSNNNFFLHGTLKANPSIGYIYIRNLSDELGGTGRLKGNQWKKEIEIIIKGFNDKNINKLIVDIRSLAGGSNFNALYIANRFANNSSPYMIEQIETDNGQNKELTYTVTPKGKHHFREGKIVLLSNNLTCSGGEMFLLAMRKRKNLIHIGTPSYGCSGAIIQRDLYNGWNLTITSSKTFFPDYTSYFKKGIRPQIIVKNDESYATNKQDKLIKHAVIELE